MLSKIMHIKVDSKTKCYRVVVIGENINDPLTVEIYQSGVRQWTKTTPPLGCIFGVTYEWECNTYLKIFQGTSFTQSVYD